MPTDLLTPVLNLGVAGFAIYVLWKQGDARDQEREKHAEHDRLEREKFMLEINEAVKTHNLFQKEVRTEIMGQLGKNTTVFERVLDHLAKH